MWFRTNNADERQDLSIDSIPRILSFRSGACAGASTPAEEHNILVKFGCHTRTKHAHHLTSRRHCIGLTVVESGLVIGERDALTPGRPINSPLLSPKHKKLLPIL